MLAADPLADVSVEEPSSERVTTSIGGYMGGYRKAGSIRLMMSSNVREIREREVIVTNDKEGDETIPNDAVFAMIGREPPLEFFRRSGVHIRGEWRLSTYASFILVLLAVVFVYHWKKPGAYIADVPPLSWIAKIGDWWAQQGWFPYNVPEWWGSLGAAFANKANILGTLRISVGEPGFYYSLAYCLCVALFGLKRISRRKTPYVKVQTSTLMAVQIIPLFLLPYILLPWMGNNGWFDGGALGWLADQLFPKAGYGHGREYWRVFGLILAWPLFFWNVFTDQPMWLWLMISFVQTFIIIPLIIYYWGKGAYCGWICSCGALAETMGDAHRHKMPHGPFWNRFNMVGQVFLWAAFFLLITRSLAWAFPWSFFGGAYDFVFKKMPVFNYVWFVDLLWAGIIGVGFYWHFSGRMWCRFACPLAALMHIYTRFSRFRILADKKKCISCNVCTSVCHQGIDIMNFANKGLPMEDPECVRCSACVQMCPTGVLEFGQVNRRNGEVIKRDPKWLAASPVLIAEGEVMVNGRRPQKK
jgi:NosR/NirI family transcriptional regulator, nitrous oxide reductase regulator